MTFDATSVRIKRLEEGIQIIKGLFAEAPFSFSGQYYSVRDLSVYPQPVQRPHPPILIGAGKENMLKLAGREADIVGLLTSSVASGTLSDDPTEQLAETVQQKIDWIREGAGERFEQIELSLIPTLIITDEPRQRAEQIIQERGWQDITPEQVLNMPSRFMGTLDEIADLMLERRETYGFSYYVLADQYMEMATPLVERLAGK